MCDDPEQKGNRCVGRTARRGGFLLFLLASLVLSACREQEPSKRDRVTEEVVTDDTADAARPTDAFGSPLPTPDPPPTRLLSLAPNLTEIIAWLGAGDRLVGRTDFCTYPAEIATTVPSIGTLGSYSYEQIVALQPDITLMMSFEGSSRKEHARLGDLGVHPVAMSEGGLDEVVRMIDTVRGLLYDDTTAQASVTSLKNRLDSLRGSTPSPTPSLFLVISTTPLITTSDLFLDEIIRVAGARNVAADESLPYPKIGREQVPVWAPDLIVVPVYGYPSSIPHDSLATALLAEFPEWEATPAGKSRHIFGIDADMLTRPGPRVVDAIVELRSLIERAK